jgi:hypothetical protein
VRGVVLRKLDARICELGIDDDRALLGSSDQTLQTLLREYMGEWLDPSLSDASGLLNRIRISAELPFPDEVFADYQEIVFDSAGQFAEKADRFLEDEDRRSGFAEAMRQVVIEQFSYRPTMDRFLRAMGDYLNQASNTVGRVRASENGK